MLVACAAETIILALSGFRGENLCGRLEPTTIAEIGRVAGRLGFSAGS
jgi:predicted amino acid dehydrogenase